MPIHRAAAEGFSRNADDYERTRPSYSAEAVAYLDGELGLGPGTVVVDLAAGTGKLTRLLVGSGATVLAIEPVTEMRDQLRRAVPSVPALAGTAEHLPLRTSSIDAVTVAQAFHWFDAPVALAAIHDALRPGGALAVVYNEREPVTTWYRDLQVMIEPYRHDPPQQRRERWHQGLRASPLFAPPEMATFDNPQFLTPEEVVGRFRSLSFVGALDPAPQRELLAGLAAKLASHPETAGLDRVELAQRTVIALCRPR